MTTDVGVEPEAASDQEATGSALPPRHQAWWPVAAALLVANAPIVVATVRALLRGWQPLGDNGILLVRAMDVGTRHNPLLGSWTSASLPLGEHVNNPGPLYSDLLALPVRLLGPWAGLAAGVMLVNVAATSLAVLVARRGLGVEAMAAATLGAALLQFAMGSELLFDVWQPNALVLPFFAFTVVVAALAAGDRTMLAWAVGVGSVVVQTHMSYAPVVALLLLVGVVAAVRAGRRVAAAEGPAPSWRRPLAVAGVVVLLAWCQPLVEQFTAEDDGNLTRIVEAVTSDEGDTAAHGRGRATRLLAQVEAAGPWFAPGTYAEPFSDDTGLNPKMPGVVGLGPAVAIVVAVTAALVGLVVWARRSGRDRLAALLVVALAAHGAVWLAVSVMPIGIGGMSPHTLRVLWPVGALVSVAGLTALLSALGRRPALSPWLVGVILVGAAVVAGFNLPTRPQPTGPTADRDALPAALELVGGLDALEGRGPVLFDPDTLRFAEPYSGLVFAELRHRGIEFTFDDEGFIRQFGEGRREDGSAELRMWLVEGPRAEEVPPGVERVGYADGPWAPVALFVEPLEGDGAGGTG